MRNGLIAAGLAVVAAAALLATGGRAQGASLQLDHTCSATDRQFVRVAGLNMIGVGMAGENYRAGVATAKEVAREAARAAQRVRRLAPRDPSLHETKLMITAMFTEYGAAIAAQDAGRPAGRHMRHAYELANYIYDVLVDAAPELRRLGCDVSGLL